METVGLCFPAFLDQTAVFALLFPHALALVDLNALQRCGESNALGIEGAADESSLGGIHDIMPANDGCQRITVCHPLGKNRNVRMDAENPMTSAGTQPESGGHFVKHEDDAFFFSCFPDFLQKIVLRPVVPDRLHDDCGNLPPVFCHEGVELIDIVVMERKVCSGKSGGHAQRLQAGDMQIVQSVFICQVCGQIPVMPSVIAAEKDDILFCGCPGDPGSQRHGLAAGLCETDTAGPGMKLQQLFGQRHFFRRVQGGHAAVVNGLLRGGIDLVVGITQDVGSDAHIADVDVFVAVQIPDFAALGL